LKRQQEEQAYVKSVWEQALRAAAEDTQSKTIEIVLESQFKGAFHRFYETYLKSAFESVVEHSFSCVEDETVRGDTSKVTKYYVRWTFDIPQIPQQS
jgi:hypothetical protein